MSTSHPTLSELTLRDLFAAFSLAGQRAGEAKARNPIWLSREEITRDAYLDADLMLDWKKRYEFAQEEK